MITIFLNDESYPIKSDLSLLEFLLHHHHGDLHFAIAINNQFIPRAAYHMTLLHEGDRVDIIVPMQGG
jgi:sulfur carrier protein